MAAPGPDIKKTIILLKILQQSRVEIKRIKYKIRYKFELMESIVLFSFLQSRNSR